jgi:hypothetical protein
MAREDWEALAMAFYALVHGSRREFDSLPDRLRNHPLGRLCLECLDHPDPRLTDETGGVITGSPSWYVYLGRYF